jgi:multidrug resistance protein, MATE family
MDLGVVGASIALNITNFLNFVIFYVYCARKEELKQAWKPFSKECWKDWRPYLGIALPSCLVYIAFYSLNPLALLELGFISIQQQAVVGVLLNLEAVLHSFFIGWAYALYSYLGNAIGAGIIAKRICYSSFVVWFLSFFLQMIFIICFRNEFAQLFFATEEDQDMFNLYLVYLEINVFLIGNNYIIFSIFRALGKQKAVTLMVVLITIIFGCPATVYFTFDFGYNLEILGIWIALLLTNLFISLAMGGMLFTLNFKEISIKVQKTNVIKK